MRVNPSQAISLLELGEVVALPTETVYGLAATIHSESAVEQIYSLKRRPLNNPLIIHLSDPEELNDYVSAFPPRTKELAQAFWPGALTLILPIVEERILPSLRASLPTAAFRIPNHPLTQQVLRETGPLVMPSANLSGSPSATTPAHVEHDFGPTFPILDGGECHQGLESTILHFLDGAWVILRLGALPAEAFRSILGYTPAFQSSTASRPLSPGQLHRHYAPRARLVLSSSPPREAFDSILGFSDYSYASSASFYALGSTETPQQCAHALYATLRQLDDDHRSCTWVDTRFPQEGLWKTIAERLERAAT